jgi:hypothetical protein
MAMTMRSTSKMAASVAARFDWNSLTSRLCIAKSCGGRRHLPRRSLTLTGGDAGSGRVGAALDQRFAVAAAPRQARHERQGCAGGRAAYLSSPSSGRAGSELWGILRLCVESYGKLSH